MDSLRLIYFRPRNPSWIWIRYVQHAFHKHHKNLLCRSERHSALDTKLHCGLEYFLTRPTTRCHFQHPAKPFRLKHPASLNTTSLAAPRTNLHKAANKNFRCCVLFKSKSRKTICVFFKTAIECLQAQGILGNARHVWAMALHPGPP